MASVPPTSTVIVFSFENPVPLILTRVSPSVEPSVGEIEVTVGGARYVNSVALAEGTPSGSVTTTLSLPAAVAAVVALISVADLTSTLVASEPILTVDPLRSRCLRSRLRCRRWWCLRLA